MLDFNLPAGENISLLIEKILFLQFGLNQQFYVSFLVLLSQPKSGCIYYRVVLWPYFYSASSQIGFDRLNISLEDFRNNLSLMFLVMCLMICCVCFNKVVLYISFSVGFLYWQEVFLSKFEVKILISIEFADVSVFKSILLKILVMDLVWYRNISF